MGYPITETPDVRHPRLLGDDKVIAGTRLDSSEPDVRDGMPARSPARVSEPPPSDLRAYMAANAVPAILPP